MLSLLDGFSNFIKMSNILLLFTILTENLSQSTRILSTHENLWKMKTIQSSQILFNSITQQAESTVSQLPSYEIKEIPGKGSGVCAIRDISVGELLMEERPLFMIDSKKSWFTPSESYSEMRVQKEIEKLSVADQTRFYSLHGFISNNNDNSSSDIPGDISNENNDNKSYTMFKNSNAENNTEYKESKSLKMRLPAIHTYRTNAYPCGQGKSGIFPLISRLNSHCIPNAHYNYDVKKGKSTVYCISPIKKGEEIVNCYLGLYIPKIERMRYLWRNFGFLCSCKSCTLTGVEQEDSDKRRMSLDSLEEMTVTAILEKKKRLALDLVQLRIDTLQEEGLSNAVTLFKCEYDAFLAISGINSSTAAVINDLVSGADCTSSSEIDDMLDLEKMDSMERLEAREWLEKAYNHVVLAKGPDATEAYKCYYYLSIFNLI
jgi:hypothetical protein